MNRNQLLITSEFLGVLHIHIFQIKKGRSWMTREKNVFFLVLVISQKLISFTIQTLRKYLLVETLFFMKIKSGNGAKM